MEGLEGEGRGVRVRVVEGGRGHSVEISTNPFETSPTPTVPRI